MWEGAVAEVCGEGVGEGGEGGACEGVGDGREGQDASQQVSVSLFLLCKYVMLCYGMHTRYMLI